MDFQSVGQAAGLLLLGLYTAWNSRKTNKQTKAVGNGFAHDVKQALKRIENKIDRHLQDHAGNDVRGKGDPRAR